MGGMTVYISIGNSDGKLTQQEWAAYWHAADGIIRGGASRVYGVWLSLPNGPYANACWCVEIIEPVAKVVRDELRKLADAFRQDSIAWAVAETEFLKP